MYSISQVFNSMNQTTTTSSVKATKHVGKHHRRVHIHATQDELNAQISNFLEWNHQSTLKYEVKAKSVKQLEDIRRVHEMQPLNSGEWPAMAWIFHMDRADMLNCMP